VGHPLFERLADQPPDAEAVAAIRAKGEPVLAVLPGSRRHVVGEVLPGQLEVARRLGERFDRLHVGVSVANPQVAPVIEAVLGRSGVGANCYVDRNADLLTAADLALVASGTATLEVAYRHTPMIVMYNANRWFYHLVARWLISTPHLSLINILADRRIVPEFMPYYRSIDPIAEQAATLLADADARRKMSAELAALLDPLVKIGAAKNAAKILLEMIDSPSPPGGPTPHPPSD
ncbi:MAG: hypothetical protein IID40_03330, partial [Planctomycetes bacterium]|nr:hypothetical protein [Planctomycetota bacterium]